MKVTFTKLHVMEDGDSGDAEWNFIMSVNTQQQYWKNNEVNDDRPDYVLGNVFYTKDGDPIEVRTSGSEGDNANLANSDDMLPVFVRSHPAGETGDFESPETWDEDRGIGYKVKYTITR